MPVSEKSLASMTLTFFIRLISFSVLGFKYVGGAQLFSPINHG
jgi:hypothetical protein